MKCSHACKHHGPCRFGEIPPKEEFVYEGSIFCMFHAPMDAVRSRDAVKKADMSDEELATFNEHFLSLLSEDDTPVLEGDPPPSDLVIAKLKSTFPGRPIGRNELRSWWARKLRTISLEITKMPRNNFAHVVFPGPLVVKGRKIGRANFEHCEFHGDVEIEDCEFVGRVDFDHARFFVGCTFSGTTFRDCFHAEEAQFMGPAHFGDAKFKDSVKFEGARFQTHVHLCCKAGSEREHQLMQELDVRRATFDGLVCFKHRLFFGLNVENTRFAEPPQLAGAQIEAPCSLSSASYARCEYVDQIAYTTLQRLAASAGDREGVDLFRFLSFLALMQNKSLSKISRSVLWCYKAVSQFGTDVGRAGLSLLLVNLVMLPMYAAALAVQCGRIPAVSSVAAAWAATLFKPLGILHQGAAVVGVGTPHADLLIALVASMHALGSGTLLAVFLHTVYRTISRE
ncbi:hypothetical protein WJ54_16135 [Burkholderia ubonensis]|uniref:pentapeptide repeat-containing protein n=1 Tax=Burkholderia ubonensis TaxID=101571 RepID=UPI00076BE7EA|nr:pentapeptide repeat-containing protein [Burkholderia ubonensis]KVM26779.1 hypothetical protein WJ54_16135 [Burkholderia ubonensis]